MTWGEARPNFFRWTNIKCTQITASTRFSLSLHIILSHRFDVDISLKTKGTCPTPPLVRYHFSLLKKNEKKKSRTPSCLSKKKHACMRLIAQARRSIQFGAKSSNLTLKRYVSKPLRDCVLTVSVTSTLSLSIMYVTSSILSISKRINSRHGNTVPCRGVIHVTSEVIKVSLWTVKRILVAVESSCKLFCTYNTLYSGARRNREQPTCGRSRVHDNKPWDALSSKYRSGKSCRSCG